MKKDTRRMKMLRQLLLFIAAVTILAVTVHAQVNLSSGLMAHYPFNGNANDISGNNNNGTLSGSAVIIADQWGNPNSACNMLGPNNAGRVTIANSATLQFSSTASFAFWFRLNSNVGTNGFGNIVAGGSHCVFAKDGDAGGGLYFLTSLSGNNLAMSVGNVSMTTLNYTYPSYTVGTWLHCVYIMDATEQRLYINGNLVATVAGAPNFGTMNTKQLCLGRFGSNWYPIDGALDEFRVYNRVLNTDEISALAANNPASVAVTNVSPLSGCVGSSISVDFTSAGVSAGNVYSLLLSDAAGNFTFPLTIGTLTSSASSGTITTVLPAGLPSGSGYKVKVSSNLPTSTSAASTQSITVNGVLGDIPNPSLFRYIGSFNGKEFYYCATAQTWTNAQATCVANGGNLVTIPDAATNTFIRSNIPAGIFIGLTDQVTEGTFAWIDGSPVTYTNWNAGEPNNSGNEDYVQLYPPNGVWNDVNAAATAAFVLQLNPAQSNSPVCSGSPLTFFTPTISGATYQWNGPNGFSSTQQNPVIASATLADAGTYSLTITHNGCSATATCTVTVTQSPDAMNASSAALSSLSSGLVLYYPMNGNANDASGNNYHGTLMGGMTTVADRFGNPTGALKGNATNAYISVPAGVYFNGDFTVSCWVKTPSYTNWGRIIDFGNGQANNNVVMAFSYGTTGKPASETYNGTVTGGQCVSTSALTGLNQWVLLTYTFSSGAAKVYINGNLAGTGTQTTPQNVTRALCYVGRSNWASDPYPNASFDDLRIYNRVITSVEMYSLVMEQPDAMNLVAMPAAICPNTASTIKVIGTQIGVTYQLQNASTSANIGAAQTGNGDTLSFATGNLSSTTSFQVVATGSGSCSVIISSVTVSVITAANAPATTGASRCGTGSVTLSASGAPNGAVYYWYTSAVGGSPVFIGPAYTTPSLNGTTTYYVSIYANGCETNRTPVVATIDFATSPAVDLYSGLIMYYKLDGNTADSSGRNNNATLTSGTYVNDRFNQPNRALNVVSNNYMDCGAPSDIQALTNQVTVSMWIYENYYGGGHMPLLNDWANTGIYSATYGYFDANGQQNRVRWRVDGNAYMDSYVNVPFNQWTLITCTYDGATLKTYQDGVLTGSYNYTGTIGYTGTPVQIGRQANGSGSQIFAGNFDDIRVYNRALNADEVHALYNNGSVAFSNTPLCEGNTLQLSTVSIPGATYAWNGPNGFSSSQQNPPAIPNATAAVAGTYSLVVTNPNNGCVSPVQTNLVVVNPLPGNAVTINDTVCGSGNATLTASGATNGATYLWYANATGGLPISGQTSATYTINNLTATDTFYVSIVSASGCESPGRTMVIAYFVNPVLTTLPVSGSTVCADASSATVTIQNSQTSVNYIAYYNSNPVSVAVAGTGGTITLNVNTANLITGSNTIVIHATQNSCGTVTLSNTATIVINALPSATITASGPLTFCTGGDVTLSAPAASSWLWSNGATTQSILVDTAGNFSVTITDANGCSNSSAVTAVNEIASPVATLSASGPLTFCQGDNVVLTASGGTSYTWSTGATTTSVSVNASGVYYVIASNGSCTDTSSLVTVNVNPLPAVSFSMGADTFFCLSAPVYTLSGGTPAGGSYSGPGVSGGQFNAGNAGAGNVQLAYTYTDGNGCAATAFADVVVDVCTGELLSPEASAFNVMPNPTSGMVTVQWTNADHITSIEVFDVSGRLIISENVSGKTTTQLSLEGLRSGVYQLKLSGEKVLYTKLVKE